ncbi:MAG: hypothetical protein FJX71_06720 [Alphaproteobacteria bacterium]|nr:hypothetical protein [Alphaproteobacteria bacterium]
MAITKVAINKPSTNTAPVTDNPPIGSVTSSFFVSMDDLLHSNVENYETAAPLLWFNSVEERVTVGNKANEYQASATIYHSLIELHLQTDSKMPVLRQHMRNNNNIAEMKISRVGHIGDGSENTEFYSSTYTNCHIEHIEEFPDKIIVKVSVSTRSDTAAETSHDAVQATTSGSTASGWDYTTNKAMA